MAKITSHSDPVGPDNETAFKPVVSFANTLNNDGERISIARAIRRYDILAIWLMLTSANLFYHRLIPLDETRYAAVAWEMWIHHDFWVPYLNGIPYHHKPPLLFWLYHSGWSLFGVSELWLLMVSPLCGLASLYWVRHLSSQLWPGRLSVIRTAPWLLLGTLIWGAFMNGAMFDMLLGLCVLLAVTGLIKSATSSRWIHWSLFSLGCGLGLLAKGPAVFLYTLAPFLLGGFWSEQARTNPKRWYLHGALATLGSIVLALCWVIPAVKKGGDAYGFTLLWHQTVDRMVDSFAHRRPFWWYFVLSPAILFPWIFWPRLWRLVIDPVLLKDSAVRFCLLWLGSGFLAFSMVSGKQVHYLLPLMPALALLISRAAASDGMAFRLGDALPYLVICSAGLLLLLLPYASGIRLYNWISTRPIWWPCLIVGIGLGGLGFALTTRRIAPHHYAIAIVLVLASSLAGFFSSAHNGYDLRPATKQLSTYLKLNEPLAWAGDYDGQFEFLMRLKAPLTVIKISDLWNWLEHHPNGHVVLISDDLLTDHRRLKIDYRQPYREQWLMILSASAPLGN